MSNPTPSRSHQADEPRSLRNRIFEIFRSSPKAGPSTISSEEAEPHDLRPGAESASQASNERTRLLESYTRRESVCGTSPCNHGTFSPKAVTEYGYGAGSVSSLPEAPGAEDHSEPATPRTGSSGVQFPVGHTDSVLDSQEISATKRLALEHGVKYRPVMYLSYYIPFLNWIRQYRWSFFQGDLLSSLTLASIYIPMALSLSSNLAHAPAINGLYSFVINPLIYAFLGSSPQLVVGPEAAGSLLVGTMVKTSVDRGHSNEDDQVASARVVGVVTGMAGSMILIAGLTRLGFLDNVLSRPFLRGFITAIGFVIFVDQLIPEMGLARRAKEVGGVSHGSTVEKLAFLVRNASYSHRLTCAVAFGSFAVIMIFRVVKRRLEKRYPQVTYFPDRLLVVVLCAVLTWRLGWDKKGLEILGETKSAGNGVLQFVWPFRLSHMKHIRTAMSTSFIIALLGFFESSVAAKGLGDGAVDGLRGTSVSPNREMVALGLANVVGGCFMALPAFGGYGRSKVNASTGGRTPMSSIFLSIITFIVIQFFLSYLYYLPKAVLCSMISVVAYTLVEECPHDVFFFIRIRGWSELTLMGLIFLVTIFYSLEVGIALGMGLSILSLVRHSTQPRIQILGKVQGKPDQFENAELYPENVVFIEGVLIVKIPEPLTFANTGDLKNRLRRLEYYGTSRAHPALPRIRPPEHNKNIIFDVHGVTSIDGSGTQVLAEIVKGYVDQGVRVFFCRLPTPKSDVFRKFERSGIVDYCGGSGHFVPSVEEALRLAETENVFEP
ncbi:hypothetical protein DTO271G3_7606 [Paecilomyces variotii]|nr:hypothetical protein DTO271G3_7606 [Paecilomyces variotii]